MDLIKKLLGLTKNTMKYGAAGAAYDISKTEPGQAIMNLLAPKATSAGRAAINTGGMFKDAFDYNAASNPQQKQQELLSYNNRRNSANDALKQFGFDADKQGSQFDPGQYARGVTAGGGELASLASPMSGGFKARTLINAVPGAANAIGEGKDFKGVAGNALLSSILGMGGEGLVKGGGALLKGIGGKVADTAENLGLRRYGLTKMDVNKLGDEMGIPVQQFLKENNLIGKSVEDLRNTTRPLQDSFDAITNNENLKINPDNILESFSKKINELKNQSAPELQKKGADLEKYATNYLIKKGQDFSGKGVTGERRVIDSLVKDFSGQGGDALSASKNRAIRDTLQESVRGAADQAGLTGPGGESLKDLGDKLRQMYQFEDVASKRNPQQTGLPAGLLKSIFGGAGATVGMGVGGPVGALLGGGAGMATESVLNNPNVIQKAAQVGVPLGNSIAQGGEKFGNNQAIQKVIQQLGQKGGNAMTGLFNPENPNTQNENTNNQTNATQNIQGSNNINNTDILTQQGQNNAQDSIQSDKQGNKWIQAADGGILSTDKQWKWDSSANDWTPNQNATQQSQPQQQQGFTPEKIQMAMDTALQTGNVKAFQQLAQINDVVMGQALKQAQLEKLQGGTAKKPLAAATENRVQLAKSGLRGLDSIESILKDDPSKAFKASLPGALGARDYDSAAFRSVEGLLRARSGAAIPETEVRRYMKANLPTIGDTKADIKFKLNAFRKDLEDVSNSGGQMSEEDALTQALSQLQNQ